MALRNILSKASGLNWYKWGAILAILLATHISAYQYGKYTEREEALKAAAIEAQEQAAYVVETVQARIPVVQQRDVEAAQLQAELRQIKGKLDAAINQATSRPECALTGEELKYFQELSEYSR